jgi:general secretion pathway protein A
MCRVYFKLKENPFTPSPDPKFFCLAPNRTESIARCEYAIRNKSGLAVVYSGVGTGKTTILNKLQQRFGDEQFTIAVLIYSNQTGDTALLKAVAGEFGREDFYTSVHDGVDVFLVKQEK